MILWVGADTKLAGKSVKGSWREIPGYIQKTPNLEIIF
jgi:hypothetical protein